MAVREGYKQTEVGVIPEDWESVNLKEYIVINSGESPSRFNLLMGGTPFFKVEQLNNSSKYQINTPYFIDRNKLVDKGSLLFPKRGASILLNKIRILGQDSYMDTNLMTLTVNNSELNNEYLYYTLDKLELWRIADTTSIPQINNKHIYLLRIPMPPLPEQKAIATALSDTDGLINSLTKLIEKKKNIKQGAMQELLTGKKRLEGFSGAWVEKALEELCYLVTKQTGFDYTKEIKPSLKNKKDIDCYPFIQNKDFEGRAINYNTDFYIPIDIANKYPNILINEKCLLISISGRIGNIGVFDSDQNAFIGGAVGIARFRDKSLIDWVLLYLLSKNGQKQIISKEKAGAQHNLTVYDVRKLIIPIPQKREAERITQIIFDMDSEIEKLHSKLDKYKAIKQGMMQELLTGRIRLLEGA